ncbi:MAG: hypothetical protein ACREGC_00120 [Minisyncoccia bacterium]
MSAPILSAYDWEMSQGFIRHLRAGFLDAGNNGKLQYRYVYPDGTVQWRDLIPQLSSVNFNFTSWWSPAALPVPPGTVGYSQALLLFVNGQSLIYEWSGGVTTFASSGTVVGGITSVLNPSDVGVNNSFGGKNYQPGDIVTVTGGSGTATLEVISTVQGGIFSINTTPTAGGSGYFAGQVVDVTGPLGSIGGEVKIDTVDGSGTVLTCSLFRQGQGYITGTGFATVGVPGTGFTVEITEVDDGVIYQWEVMDAGTGYTTASNVAVTGGSGSNATADFVAGDFFTMTKQGTDSWTQEGFYSHGTHQVMIDGNVFTVTGGWGTTTLTGVTPDPSTIGPVPGDVVEQVVEFIPNSSMRGLPANFENDLIANFDQQLYLGSLKANTIFVSWTDQYQRFDFGIPRITGEGILLITNAPPKGFIVQEDNLYVSAGQNQWYTVTQNQQTITTPENTSPPQLIQLNVITPTLNRLKTTGLQGAQSQAFINKNKNDVIFVSFEPIANSLGRVENILVTPQISDLSFPIVNDMNKYNFTDGCIFFWQNFIFVAVPKENLIRMYNMTKDTTTQNPTNDPIHYWEAPLTIPLSRFSIIDGELYGHSYLVSETYKLFEGYNFNGHPIPALAVFSYQQYGVRTTNKSENEFYVEGYISENATLDMTINYELDGTGGQYNGEIVGTDTQIVNVEGGQNSLGKESLGKNPLGGDLVLNDNNTNKFRVIKTFPRTPYYEASPQFGTSGIDFIWSLIAFGPAQSPTTEGNNPITQ